MVCLGDDVICVPKGSVMGIPQCVPKCGDSTVCANGDDAVDCRAELSGGIVALIVIVCIVVLIAIPIIIIFVRRRLGLRAIPKQLQSVIRFMRCCITEDKDQSAIELANSSMTSQSPNGISNPALNTSGDDLKPLTYTRVTSTEDPKKYEYTVDYTVHQTNPAIPAHPYNTSNPAIPAQPYNTSRNYSGSQRYNTNQQHTAPQSNYTAQDTLNSRAPQIQPFMITSQDGQRDYEIRSHIKQPPPQHQTDTESHNQSDNREHGYRSGEHGFTSGEHGYRSGEHGYRSGEHGYMSGEHGYRSGEQGYRSGEHGYRSGEHGFTSGEHGYRSGEQGYRSGETGAPYYRSPPRPTGYQPTTHQQFSGRSGYQPRSSNSNQNNSVFMSELPPDQLRNALQRITRNEDLSPLNDNTNHVSGYHSHRDTTI